MRKKSLLLFILWVVAVFVMTCICMVLLRFPGTSTVGWILFLRTAVVTLAIMSMIRTNAKAEQIIWLAVVSKVLLIVYSIEGAFGLFLFIGNLLT